MVGKTELIRILSFHALSKIHLDKYGSSCKIWPLLSWDINLSSGSVHKIHKEIIDLLLALPFYRCNFSGNLNKSREMFPSMNIIMCYKKYSIHININSLLPKVDEVRYAVKVTNVFII